MVPANSGAGRADDGRLTFQEAMSLVALAPARRGDGDGGVVRRYMSTRRAWMPGAELPLLRHGSTVKGAAFGGHVFSQAGVAAARALGEEVGVAEKRRLGIHTMHGYFPERGLLDRPFVYEVSRLAEQANFPNLLVTVRQPVAAAGRGGDSGDDDFQATDAQGRLGKVCFDAIVSFRPATPSQAVTQARSSQERFASILASRPASAWGPASPVDIAALVQAVPPPTSSSSSEAGSSFPAVEMRKVDMAGFNRGRPVHARRELILYRLLAPLAASDHDAHIMVHAFEADRNSLLMIGNHVGYGFDFGRASSLSYSSVVHVNAQDAVMSYGPDQWWIQEASFPRTEAGRGVIVSKIWSPAGVHVATQYQDGIIQAARGHTVAKL